MAGGSGGGAAGGIRRGHVPELTPTARSYVGNYDLVNKDELIGTGYFYV